MGNIPSCRMLPNIVDTVEALSMSRRLLLIYVDQHPPTIQAGTTTINIINTVKRDLIIVHLDDCSLSLVNRKRF